MTEWSGAKFEFSGLYSFRGYFWRDAREEDVFLVDDCNLSFAGNRYIFLIIPGVDYVCDKSIAAKIINQRRRTELKMSI